LPLGDCATGELRSVRAGTIVAAAGSSGSRREAFVEGYGVLPVSRVSVREGREPTVAVFARVSGCAVGMLVVAVGGWGTGGGGSACPGRRSGSSPSDVRPGPGDIPLWDRWSMRGPTGFEGGTEGIFFLLLVEGGRVVDEGRGERGPFSEGGSCWSTGLIEG